MVMIVRRCGKFCFFVAWITCKSNNEFCLSVENPKVQLDYVAGYRFPNTPASPPQSGLKYMKKSFKKSELECNLDAGLKVFILENRSLLLWSNIFTKKYVP